MMSNVSLEAHEISALNRCRPVERVSRWPLRNYVSAALASLFDLHNTPGLQT
jgi:hypothetical protein